MAESLVDRLKKRKEAIESGDATGGKGLSASRATKKVQEKRRKAASKSGKVTPAERRARMEARKREMEALRKKNEGK